jgi:hypothetical protein
MTSVGDGGVAAGDVRVHPASKGLGITGIVLGLVAVLVPLTIYLIALLPGQMNTLWFLFFAWPVMITFAAIGLVLSIVGLVVGFASRRGVVPVAAIIGTVLDVLVIAGTLFMFTGGLSAFM